jgi:hypothetical protein
VLQPKLAITPKVFFFKFLLSLGLAYLGVFTLVRDNQGVLVFFFFTSSLVPEPAPTRWKKQPRSQKERDSQSREESAIGDEREPRREMQGKERDQQVPGQTWQRARQALTDRGLCIFIFLNLILSSMKKGENSGQGRGERIIRV